MSNKSQVSSHIGYMINRPEDFSIDDLSVGILSQGFRYEDIVRSKPSIVCETSFSGYFHCLNEVDLKRLVGQDAVIYAKLLYNAARDNKKGATVANGLYIVDDYIEAVQKAIALRQEEKISNRRSIIYFKPEHCFQSMQFMRDRDDRKVVVSMRSCNLHENFAIDLALSWLIADKVFNHESDNTAIHVVMNIASLHVLGQIQES